METETVIFQHLQLDWEAPKECEHSKHHENPDAHEGGAVWYYQIQCPQCGKLSPLKAVCDKWKVLTGDFGVPVYCLSTPGNGCHKYSSQWRVIVCERIEDV